MELDFSGTNPRRDILVTVYPSAFARRHIVCPKNPVPPNTNILPFSLLLPRLVIVVVDEDDIDNVVVWNCTLAGLLLVTLALY